MLERVLARSLAKMDLRARVAAALAKRKKPARGVRLIAAGKAAPAMAQGALDQWGSFEELLIVTTDDTRAPRSLAKHVRHASHPIPDRRSVLAGEEAMAMAARSADDKIPLLVLISGGASALLCAPNEGVTLKKKQDVTKRLLASNAPIQKINTMRKRLSRIKGGGLALAAAPASVPTLIASDVINGQPIDVGSGPTVLGPYSDAKIIASPEELAKIFAAELRAEGFAATVLPASQESVKKLAREYRELASSMEPGHAFVRAAEPSLNVSAAKGRGGRSTHLATLVVARSSLPATVTFMAAATDGSDGSSETAGAIVDASSMTKADADRALASFNTGVLVRKAGCARAKNPSGHNLADLHVLLCSA